MIVMIKRKQIPGHKKCRTSEAAGECITSMYANLSKAQDTKAQKAQAMLVVTGGTSFQEDDILR